MAVVVIIACLSLYACRNISAQDFGPDDIANILEVLLNRDDYTTDEGTGEIEDNNAGITDAGAVDDREKINAMVDDFTNGKQTELPEYVSDNSTLMFESEKYKGIYYIIEYLVDDKGNNYLYDRWTGRCVLCSVRLTDGGGAGSGSSAKKPEEIREAREG